MVAGTGIGVDERLSHTAVDMGGGSEEGWGLLEAESDAE